MLVIIHSCITTTTIEIQNPPSPQEVPFNLFGVIPTLAPATSDLFFITMVLPFLEFQINGIEQCVVFASGFFHSADSI